MNTSSRPPIHLQALVQQQLSRRALLRGGATAAGVLLVPSLPQLGCIGNETDAATALAFTPVARTLRDAVTVPDGYQARVLYAFGDPIAAGVPAFTNTGTETGFDQRAGDQHDGIAYFGLGDDGSHAPDRSDRGLLVINHEQLLDAYLHEAGPTSDADGHRPAAEVDKELQAHGVSVIEVQRDDNAWRYIQDSPWNRRITALTPMTIHGPARGHELLRTANGDGTTAHGTLNNCAHGITPWGTYLTCEENWNSYFRRGDDADAQTSAANSLLDRYGMGPDTQGWSYRGWDTVPGPLYRRFDITAGADSPSDDHRHEPNRFGYCVEIDPFDAKSTPRKRTALGRFAHEGAWFAPAVAGQPVVIYSGDDARNEYFYKFVSDALWDPADRDGGPDVGDKYLDAGTLYVARFNADGTGEWLALRHGSAGLTADNPSFPFTDAASVCIATRIAADVVGATPMDRPEWAAVHPSHGEVYLALTNNTSRTAEDATDAANPRNYSRDGSDTHNGNVHGHIIRLREEPDHASETFTWDIYLFGAPADAPEDTINISGLDDDNDFSSPDGLWFDPRGVLWIQTDDGEFPKAERSNNQMLAALPGRVGDGDPQTIDGQASIVGAPPTSDTVRRFLVGPRGCEITGVCTTPDHQTLFVNVQHPGENGDLTNPESTWPHPSGDATQVGEPGQRPRSATVVITRADGGPIATV